MCAWAVFASVVGIAAPTLARAACTIVGQFPLRPVHQSSQNHKIIAPATLPTPTDDDCLRSAETHSLLSAASATSRSSVSSFAVAFSRVRRPSEIARPPTIS